MLRSFGCGAALFAMVFLLQGCSRNVAAWQTNTTAAMQAYEEGSYAQAENDWKAALTAAEKIDSDGTRVRITLNNLGELYREEGDYADAERLHQECLDLREKTLGPDNPNVAASLDNLAETYRAEGEYGKAEPLYWRAIQIWGKKTGAHNPDLGMALNNLAELYRSEGKFAEAEPLYQQAIDVWEKTLGPNHRNVAIALENYAALLRRTHRDSRAEELEARANAIRASSPAGEDELRR